jgi:hypothetical protein
MRILAVTSPQSGVGYHRIIMPVAHMKKEYAMITDMLSDEAVDNKYDIFLMNRFLVGVTLEDIKHWRKKHGFKLVVDNDDYWQLDPSHVLYERYKQNGITEKIIEYIREADLNTCTHERLADEIYKYNKNVEILPNALPYGEEQFLDNKVESDKVRLFWSGSGTHVPDMKILEGPMKRIYQLPVRSVIAGYNDGEAHIWNMMAHWFTYGLKIDYKIYRYTETTRYMAAYADSDISIIPLIDSKFNSMKSNLKVLETAAKKNPAVVSHVNPYLNLPVHYVKKQSDWFNHVRDLVNDEQMRVESGLQLFNYCQTHFNFNEINNKRFDIYNKLIQCRSSSAAMESIE